MSCSFCCIGFFSKTHSYYNGNKLKEALFVHLLDSQNSVTASYKDYTKMWSDALEEDKEYFVWMIATSPYSKDSDPTKKIIMKVYRSGEWVFFLIYCRSCRMT